MREHDLQPLPDAGIAAQKMEILKEWGRLPSEDKVRVTAVMLRRLLEEDRDSLPSVVAESVQPLLTPDTLRQVNLSEEAIAALNNDALTSIVENMTNHFLHDVFWDELEFAAQKLLQERAYGGE
ncbi:hypothetical protein [Aggregatilinea lenta]|uniref:hypothetical protein n=1 Tax=Aggregatilinea lenta TaxID=913108 RepID=UPI0013C33D47|nr:hypothetical protein [Aggregatilinea lenta]